MGRPSPTCAVRNGRGHQRRRRRAWNWSRRASASPWRWSRSATPSITWSASAATTTCALMRGAAPRWRRCRAALGAAARSGGSSARHGQRRRRPGRRAPCASAIDERFGGEPPVARAPELASAVAAYYRDHGYRAVAVSPAARAGRPTKAPSTLTLQVDPGPRTTIRSAVVVGIADSSRRREILARLRPRAGPSVYDRVELQERLLDYETDLRGQGVLRRRGARDAPRSRKTTTPRRSKCAWTPGLMVRLVYAGDPVPGGCARHRWCRSAEERSVDEDLLEDASRNIEAYLRERGYRAAPAPYDAQTRRAASCC